MTEESFSTQNESQASPSAYQQRVLKDYPFERLLPANCQDPDILFNHILKVSFLADRGTMKRQEDLQDAEQYALQQCMLRCKRDGRMKKEKSSASDSGSTADGSMSMETSQMLAKIEQQIKEGQLTKREIRQFQDARAFQAELDAIPWVETAAEDADDATQQQKQQEETAEVDNKKSAVAAATGGASDDAKEKQKPFLAEPLFASHGGQLSAAEEAEMRYEQAKQAQQTQKKDKESQTQLSSTAQISQQDGQDDDDDDVSARLRVEDLKPALPDGAEPVMPTEEQLALDPDNPELVLQPVKERINRFSYAAKFDDFDDVADLDEEQIKQKLRQHKAAATPQYTDDNIAGYVADGSVVPVQNEGELARADLPPVYRDGPAYREKMMREQYDPAQDKPFLFNKDFKFVVVSMMGPDCPQKAPRRMFRIWGVVKSRKHAEKLMQTVVKKNKYGDFWRTYCYSIQRWIGFPPKGKDGEKGTVMEGNNEFAEYLQANMDHQKHATVELEQRALDTRAKEKTEGQSIVEQLKKKNMSVENGVHPDCIRGRQ